MRGTCSKTSTPCTLCQVSRCQYSILEEALKAQVKEEYRQQGEKLGAALDAIKASRVSAQTE